MQIKENAQEIPRIMLPVIGCEPYRLVRVLPRLNEYPTALWNWTWLRRPNTGRVLSNGTVAGKLPGTGDVQDGFARP
jgi:hypothetical protein